jgi:hypothetical protein
MLRCKSKDQRFKITRRFGMKIIYNFIVVSCMQKPEYLKLLHIYQKFDVIEHSRQETL